MLLVIKNPLISYLIILKLLLQWCVLLSYLNWIELWIEKVSWAGQCVGHLTLTKFIEAAVAQLLSTEAQVLQVHALKAHGTLISLSIWRAVCVRNGKVVPWHITTKHQIKRNEIFEYKIQHETILLVICINYSFSLLNHWTIDCHKCRRE